MIITLFYNYPKSVTQSEIILIRTRFERVATHLSVQSENKENDYRCDYSDISLSQLLRWFYF